MAVLISSVMSTPVRAQQPGDLDLTFGMGGQVLTKILTEIDPADWYAEFPTTESMLVQPDGKILVCGRFMDDAISEWFGTFIVRYMPDGTLDTSFGDNGKVVLSPPSPPIPIGGDAYGYQSVGADMALQPDGKIVLIGQGANGEAILVQRYTTSGQLDTTFGTSGTTFVQGTADEKGTSIAVQPDGKIVGLGSDFEQLGAPYRSSFLLFRLNADGSPDTSFGLAGTGKVFSKNGYGGAEVLLQPDGKVLVVGGSLLTSYDEPARTLLARFNLDGSPDASFGTDGLVTHQVNNMNSATSVAALQADGKIVVAGYMFPIEVPDTHPIPGSQSYVARYNPDGSPDTGFGTDGVVAFERSFESSTNTVLLQTNGKIVVTGGPDFTVIRLHSDGTLDPGFDSGGRTVFPINAGGVNHVYGYATNGALQPDGKILVTGMFGIYDTVSHKGIKGIALIRINGDISAPIDVAHSGAWYHPARAGKASSWISSRTSSSCFSAGSPTPRMNQTIPTSSTGSRPRAITTPARPS